jgi:hypothetical protein
MDAAMSQEDKLLSIVAENEPIDEWTQLERALYDFAMVLAKLVDEPANSDRINPE